jgi:L-lactate dehydrogenase complex protein LldG
MNPGDGADRQARRNSGRLVDEFVDKWVALSGEVWLAPGGADDVRRVLAEAALALVSGLGPGSLRRVSAWATEEMRSLDLPGLLTPLGFELTWWSERPSVAASAGAPGTDLASEPGEGQSPTDASVRQLRNVAAASDLGITTCSWAAAETGSIALYATPDTGRLPSLLPTTHLALVRPSRIVRSIQDGMRLMTEYRDRQGGFPSTVNLVSGPSRTGDIEGDFAVGVHGPRRAGVVIGEW